MVKPKLLEVLVLFASPIIWNKTAGKHVKKKKLPDAKQDLGGDVGERIPPFSIDLKLKFDSLVNFFIDCLVRVQ